MNMSPIGEAKNILLPPNKTPEQPVFNIEFNFTEEYHLDVNVHQVSNNARLAVTADEVEVFGRYFIASDRSTGDWAQINWNEHRNVFESVSNRDYRAVIPAGTSRVTVMITEGDWLSVNSLRFSAVSGEHIFNVIPDVDVTSRPVFYAYSWVEDDNSVTNEVSPEPEIAPELIPEPEQITEPEPIPELAPTLTYPPIPAPNKPRITTPSPPMPNPWLIGAAASVVALMLVLTKKRRR